MQKVWLVCGVSEEIGPATLKYLLFRNQTVVAITGPRTDNKQMQLANLCKENFPMADVRLADIFHAKDTEAMVRQIVDKYGCIDRLINIGEGGLLSLYVLAAMQQVGNGHIIQFTDQQKNDRQVIAGGKTGIQSICDETEGIRYTLIDPDIFFQSVLSNQQVK